MLRASLINGNWLNLDADLSKHIETLTDPGVIEGFLVENNNTLKPGKAWVKAIRSNGETIFVYVELKSDFSFSLTSGKLWIELSQEAIDNWLLNAEDGTGIASIKIWPTLPSQNFLLLASATSWVVKDERNLIPKVGQIAQRTTALESKVEAQEEKVGKLEEAGTPDHLWIKAIVAEAFKENDEAYEYHLPLVSEVVSDCPIWKTSLTKEIHIPRFSTGATFNTLELYLKKVGEPSQNLEVEVRKAKKVSSLGLEFVVGSEVLATGSVGYSDITTAYQMKTITLSKETSVAKDEFIIIVLKQQGGTINGSNYFCIGVSKNPSLGYGVICVESEEKQNKTYANVVCNSQWWQIQFR